MSVGKKITVIAAGALGAAATGAAVEVGRRRRRITGRGRDHTAFGSLRSPGRSVVADDGVALHVEIDEARSSDITSDITLVFAHGYALNLDEWHFQREHVRGRVPAVYYDQRSHGRSGRSDIDNATIDQLGSDLARVVEECVPGRAILVGHSMGGMTIVALAEQRPELFGDKVAGVALIATTAGGLDPKRLLFPLIPARISGPLTSGALRAMHRRHTVVDRARRYGRAIAVVATDAFAFGGDVPAAYVEFVDDMLAATPVEVVAEFFGGFGSLDKFDAVGVLGEVPTTIVCGTSDRLTSIGHSRKLHSRIPGSKLVECEGAGHMVNLECKDEVNAVIDDLVAGATA